MNFLLPALLAGCLVLLASCSHPEHGIIEKSQKLRAEKNYQDAFSLVESSLLGKYKGNRPLEREAIRILVSAGIIDKAYAGYYNLVKSGSKNDSTLVDLLKDPDPKIRANAARTLALTTDTTSEEGKAMNSSSVPALIRSLSDPEAEVRRAAVFALGKLNDPRAETALIGALKDESWWVRSDCAHALGELKNNQSVQPLFLLLNDSDAQVREAVQNALSSLVKLPDVSPFIQALGSPDPDISITAAVCLTMVGNPAATPVLIKFLSDPDLKRKILALRGMRMARDPACLTAIRNSLQDPSPGVQAEALKGLYAFADRSSIPLIQALGSDPKTDPQIRGMCTELTKRLEAPVSVSTAPGNK